MQGQASPAAAHSFLEAEINLPLAGAYNQRSMAAEQSEQADLAAAGAGGASKPPSQSALRVIAWGRGRAPAFAHPASPEVVQVRALSASGEVIAQSYALDPRWLFAELPAGADRDLSGRARFATGDGVLRFQLQWDGAPEEFVRRAGEIQVLSQGPRGEWRMIARARTPVLASPELDRGQMFSPATSGQTPGLARGVVQSLHRAGAPDQKLDVLLVGEGYTAAEQARWREDAARISVQLFERNPFCMFKDYFNVHRLDLISRESGAGFGRAWTKQNALGAYLGCNGVDRLACLDYKRAWEVVRGSADRHQRDAVIVIINDSRFGGSGGSMAVATTNAATPAIITHEMGHSFAGLADEYDSGYEQCAPQREPLAANITMEKDPARVKWRDLRGAGLIEGANYCRRGYYRAYPTSIMRSLQAPWRELHLRAWYARLSAQANGDINVSCPAD